ncbi:MAG: HD domain-containing protein [Nannocystaceae bacterium]|nr:HD domain-containing protein [Nannocystaceae bacterium]
MTTARAFAAEAHGTQTYGSEPYVVHLDAVAALVPDEPDLRAVAYLHDVLEDTDVEQHTLAQRFGPEVAEAVALVTDPQAPNRRARKAKLHARLSVLGVDSPASALALHVKVADRLANVRCCTQSGDPRLMVYRQEHEEFRPAAYRAGLCDALWDELDALLRPS